MCFDVAVLWPESTLFYEVDDVGAVNAICRMSKITILIHHA